MTSVTTTITRSLTFYKFFIAKAIKTITTAPTIILAIISPSLNNKRSRSLLTKPASKLSSDQAEGVSLMLGFSEDLKLAYRLKELFYCVPWGYQYVLTQTNRVRAAKSLREWIKRAKESNLKEFKACITAFNNWFNEICNSFDYPWSNGPLEGTHTKIKTLKRNCFGMKNFNLFRKRIMFACK